MKIDTSKWKVYKGNELSNADYHAEQEHMSSSNLKDVIATKPSSFDKEGIWGLEKVYDQKILGNKKPSVSNNAFDEGSLAHCLILEPHLLEEEFAIYQGFRKAGNDFKTFKAVEEEGLNRTIVSKSQMKKVQSWVDGYSLNQTAVDMVAKSEAEYSLFGEIDGVKIKVRADCINIEEGYIADVKTTSYDTDVDTFRETVDGFQYELSGALYAKLFSMYYGKKFDFYFIALGKKDRSCEIYKLSEKNVVKGNKKIRDALKTFKKCKESGIWTNKQSLEKEIKSYDNYEILEV